MLTNNIDHSHFVRDSGKFWHCLESEITIVERICSDTDWTMSTTAVKSPTPLPKVSQGDIEDATTSSLSSLRSSLVFYDGLYSFTHYRDKGRRRRSRAVRHPTPDNAGARRGRKGKGTTGRRTHTHIKRFDLGQQVLLETNPIVTSTGAGIDGGSPSPLSSWAPREGD